MTEHKTAKVVAELRDWNHCWPAPGLERTVAEAADTLETQAAELARLRSVMKRLCDAYAGSGRGDHPAYIDARVCLALPTGEP